MSVVFTKIELPPKYYLAHFHELKSVLLKQYGDFFEGPHHQFIADFDNLSEDGQCLYLRLMNRKGKFFFKDSLKYSEITSINNALDELKAKQFVSDLSDNDWQDLLHFLPKTRLTDLALSNNLEFKKSWSRERIKEVVLDIPFTQCSDIVVQGRREELSYLLFLFFGKIQDNLSLYTLRDLGIRKTNEQKKNFKPRFESREEALANYFYAKLGQNAENTFDINSWPEALNLESQHLREEILLRLADEQKKAQNLQVALNTLKYTKFHPGREKRIRLLYDLDQKEEALNELNRVFEDPYSDVEYLFAEDFLARKFQKKRRSILTETLRNARKVSIDESYFRQPEAGVQDYFKEQGIASFHVENYLWNCLFGLLFWEELFESDKSSLHNEFERRPQDLNSVRFYELHEKEIIEKLEILSKEYILAKIEQKKDIPNGVFGWHEIISEQISLFLDHANLQSVREVLLYLTKDFNNRNTGFPDLMAIVDGIVKFYEVKAEGDVLKQNQLSRMINLQKAGFHVEVLQVEYVFNPDQLYVVVDIETTGGSLPYHRITELGAVKVRNGKVIDKFQTLVNPERRISREIESLTGISNAMVKDAPKFAEVAEAFSEFTRNAIFVAHNVSFDYSFIQAEFERLDERFTRPYICTKAGMRKHYPGLESYGLKKLTTHFGISLETHHRALCDAEAAAGLLHLIIEKRSGKNSSVKS